MPIRKPKAKTAKPNVEKSGFAGIRNIANMPVKKPIINITQLKIKKPPMKPSFNAFDFLFMSVKLPTVI